MTEKRALSRETDETESDDEGEIGQKRARESGDDELAMGGVHSANRWEEANLGDQQRNEKFLRLMGGTKVLYNLELLDDALCLQKEHTGRFVCGETGDGCSRKGAFLS
jgi:hypothetical protein